ncbi:MAG: HD domain-containing protein [Spirochaetales bacterium]|nr:HD domain-containing protein [Spirochaetales bacterium]
MKKKQRRRPLKRRTKKNVSRAKSGKKPASHGPRRARRTSSPARSARDITRDGLATQSGPGVRRKGAATRRAGPALRRSADSSRLRDLDSLLDRILAEARRFTRAEAGAVYLAARGRLHFNFVQNDALFKDEGAALKQEYLTSVLPVDKTSIPGYVAATGKTVLVDDAYRVKKGAGYAFNAELDRRTGYRTRSVLAVPVVARNNAVLGVLELVNAAGGRARFAPGAALYVSQLAANAGYAVENARLTREMAFRMVEMAALRDPSETAAHAERVSAIASRLYLAWAKKRAVSPEERRATREALRLAAILHDVGKVAVSDVLLKKPGMLTPRERFLVRCHTVYGARLFLNTSSPWDRAAAEVALNHHEQWNGGGYPGRMADLRARVIVFGPGKRGKEIPLLARIVAIADVYDSLVSRRAYKKPWTEDEAREFIRSKSGVLFDPELASLFLAMPSAIRAIETRYRQRAVAAPRGR